MKNKTRKISKTAKKLGRSGSSQKIGMPPGSLVHVGQIKTSQTRIDLITYSADKVTVTNNVGFDERLIDIASTSVKWVRITGLQDTQLIGTVGKAVDLHSLLLEDVLNTGQRPKMEWGENFSFFTLRTLHQELNNTEILSDQVSLLLKDGVLITFHESDLGFFDPIFDRLQNPLSRVRQFKADYLFYALIDIIVDQYFKVIENLGDEIDMLEENLFDLADKQVLEIIQKSRRDLLFVKKVVFPVREALNALLKNENKLIDLQHHRYFNDVYDHVFQMIEIIETYRELNAGIRDIFLSAQSNRMNQVMKMLTIIATIFIPLTFIVGLYGMNFDVMPELRWKYGYLGVWIFMLIIVGAMLIMFKKKRWF